MKTKAIMLVLASLGWAASLSAQAPAAPAAPAAAPQAAPAAAAQQELEPPLVQKPDTAPAGPEVVPLISFDPQFPVIEAVTNLAQQAGIAYSLAPEVVAENGSPSGVLTQAVGTVR